VDPARIWWWKALAASRGVRRTLNNRARELLDGKGPSGATAVAHTPRIPKGRATANLSLSASHHHAGSPCERAKVALISRPRNAPKEPREREIGPAAKGVTLRGP
jgi:hypothetical protein